MISHHQHARLTYEKLDRVSNALARGLANLGVKKGERVAVSLGNNVEYATATYALFKLGAILVRSSGCTPGMLWMLRIGV